MILKSPMQIEFSLFHFHQHQVSESIHLDIFRTNKGMGTRDRESLCYDMIDSFEHVNQ